VIKWVPGDDGEGYFPYAARMDGVYEAWYAYSHKAMTQLHLCGQFFSSDWANNEEARLKAIKFAEEGVKTFNELRDIIPYAQTDTLLICYNLLHTLNKGYDDEKAAHYQELFDETKKLMRPMKTIKARSANHQS